MGWRVQLGTSAASALLCQCSTLTSFTGPKIVSPATVCSCTLRRSLCDQTEAWFLQLEPDGSSPDRMGLVLPDWY